VRLIEPTSKLKSVEFLARHFGINYSLTKMYREIPKLAVHQNLAEKIAVQYATTNYNFSFALVFYDVSTLYFESFTEGDFQKCGFSKDHKHGQPQIVIGLLVNELGFPIAYNLFEGNVFEGHTILPVLKDLCARHQIKTLTVVADAGMLSTKNIEEIISSGFSYIVGARLGKISLNKAINLHGYFNYNPDHERYFIECSPYGTFVADYSVKRAKKDKRDREKQLEKANAKIKDNTASHATKFVKITKKASYTLNKDLIEKAQMMEGIKGYYTNLDLVMATEPKLVIDRYHDLWHVEKAFRMAKTDLLARPIYHYKKKSIETHLLIVFIGLCLSRALEITTNISLARIIALLWEVEDITLVDPKTHESYSKRSSKITRELTHLLNKLKTLY
jgi:transposase